MRTHTRTCILQLYKNIHSRNHVQTQWCLNISQHSGLEDSRINHVCRYLGLRPRFHLNKQSAKAVGDV